jgi:hypothetical protein
MTGGVKMKYWLMIFAVSGILLGAEPVWFGAALGNFQGSMLNWKKIPYNTFKWAGKVYLFKQDKDEAQWAVDTKRDLALEAKAYAAQMAKQEKAGKYALDNLRYQVIETENRITVYLDCNCIIGD